MILDGGMGHLLRRDGIEIAGPIGSMERFLGVALANRDAPEVVIEAHLQYLRSGADVITTNTYGCVPAAISQGSGDNALVRDLIEAGGVLAHQARTRWRDEQGQSDREVLVAGCLPPLHESYRADRVAHDAELSEVYELIVDSIAPHSDVLLCETMTSVREARAAAAAADRAGLPVWVAFTLAEDGSNTLRSGEEIATAVAALTEFPNAQAVLLNCSSASTITNAMPTLIESAGELHTGAYANGFSDDFLASVEAPQDAKQFSEYDGSLTPDVYAQIVDRWRSMGANIVGGCCGVFPEHLAAVTATAE